MSDECVFSAEERAKFIHKAFGHCDWCRELKPLPHTISCLDLSAESYRRFDICDDCHATKIIEGTSA